MLAKIIDIYHDNVSGPSLDGKSVDTYLPALMASFGFPFILLYYFILITSTPLLNRLDWIPQIVFQFYPSIWGAVAGWMLAHLIYGGKVEEKWYGYVLELTSSIFALTTSLGTILIVADPTSIKRGGTGAMRVPLNDSAIFVLVVFIIPGILLTNIYTVYPVVKSAIKSFISVLKSVFLPPYNEPNIDIEEPRQPPINNGAFLYSLLVSLSSLVLIYSLISYIIDRNNLVSLIEGHLHLIWYIEDIFSGDLVQALDGSLGLIEEVARVLTPLVLFLYLTILFLSLSYAMSLIYFFRQLQESVRIRLGISRKNMMTISTLVSVPLLLLCWYMSQYLVSIMWAIISILFVYSTS